MLNWISVSLLLAIASIYELPSRSIDFVPAFSQYDLDVNIFMDLLLGMGVDGNRGDWVLKLNKSIYRLKQARESWFDIIQNGLKRRVCHQYQVDPCVFYRKDSVILTYVDDYVIFSHKQDTIT